MALTRLAAKCTTRPTRRSRRTCVLRRPGASVHIEGQPFVVTASRVDPFNGEVRITVRGHTDGEVYLKATDDPRRRVRGREYNDVGKLSCQHKRHVHQIMLTAAHHGSQHHQVPRRALLLDSTFMYSSKVFRRAFNCTIDVPNPAADRLEHVAGVRKHQMQLGCFVRTVTHPFDFAFLDFCATVDTCEPQLTAALAKMTHGALVGITVCCRRLGARKACRRLYATVRKARPMYRTATPSYRYRQMLFICVRV